MQVGHLKYLTYADFLNEDQLHKLWTWTLDHRGLFVESTLIGDVKYPEIRKSTLLKDLGLIEDDFRRSVESNYTSWTKRLNLRPFEAGCIELEIASHNDGDSFSRHIDTVTGEYSITRQTRMLSAVYYFHREPKPFEGGNLRLFPIQRPQVEETYVEIVPIHNTLIVFPSWIPHEVGTIYCPTEKFADSRFSINIWVCRKQ